MELLEYDNGVYRTPAGSRGWFLARISPTAAFFWRYFLIIFKAARVAKRGELTGQKWAEASRDVLHALEVAGVEAEITGVEHLRSLEGPFIVAANHMSTLETMVLPVVIQPLRKTTFVVKKSLTTMPVFKYIMNSRDAIAVSQTNPREDLKTMLTEGLDRLQRDFALIVFPQGTRRLEFHSAHFNSIAVKLASRAGVPVVPCAIASDAWGLGKWVPELAKIDPRKKLRIAFDAPLAVTGRGEAAQQQTLEYITGKLREWGYAIVDDEPSSASKKGADTLPTT
ncbi:MAG: 1-acyl-sn-glycerol-3-phosphate acyltransferase [Planctomycetales bacterium]|nr:1-acyl-sn-glycerol-3-phosphate acyltransferase [Planctomycetales bacterium]